MTEKQASIYDQYKDEYESSTREADDNEDGLLVGLLWFIVEQQDKELAELRRIVQQGRDSD